MSTYNDQLEQAIMGQTVIDDTSATPGTFGGLLIINDAVINSITTTGVTNKAGLEGITLSAGQYLPIKFSTITLTSGVVSAIHRIS